MTAPTGPTQAVVDLASTAFTLKQASPARAGVSDPVFVASFLAQLVDTVTSSDGGSSACRTIGAVAAALIQGTDLDGVIGYADDRLDDLSDNASGDLRLVIKVQNDTGEGPCLEAARTGEQVLVHDLRSEARWPHFTPRAPWSLSSMLCTPMTVSGGRVGVLTVVSTRAWAFDEASARLATVVAAHGTLALGLAGQLRNLRDMAESREIIGQATGILMQRHHVDAEQAFHALARASQERNLKMLALAGQLTAAVASPATSAEEVGHAGPEDPPPPTDGGRPSGQQ